ncbi:MAG TPA: PDZ domain-containing protein [Woeseiaceae bacterium]|nr:PDZ domain-containing protein [Woeseiaceae bacterium]
MYKTSCLASLLLVLVARLAAAEPTLLLRQPAVSADSLAFVYAGDIWVAGLDGSEPRRLTSHPAEENSPVFSPDGTMIAFAAAYEGNVDTYVVPTAGGQPRRLTWHPADDVPTGWVADGRSVTVVSDRETDHGRSGQLYHAALSGGLPAKRMEARIYRGVYDATDARLAYIDHGSGYNGLFGGTAGWKGYRGGTTPAIRIMDMQAQTVVTVPGAGATNFNPLWLDGVLYFLSDRENKTFNLYRYDPPSGRIERLSNEATWDVRAAGGHGSTIVYEAGGRLKRIDTAGGVASTIDIEIHPDLPQLRPQWKDASKAIDAADLSPSGKRAILTARGEVFTLPVDEGSTRNLSDSGGQHDYSALWSPGGDSVAWVSESEGGQSLVVADQTGMGSKRQFELGPHFYELLAFGAGDDPRIVYQDNHLNLFAIELSRGDITKVASGVRREQFDVAVSHDGQWLAYTLEQPNYYRDLVLMNFASGRKTTLTDGSADAAAPAFSRDGRYLYFAASTNSGPLQVGLNMTSQERPYRAALYAAVLAADGDSPLLPGSGDENDEPADDADAGGDSDEAAAAKPVRVDVEGLGRRIVALPVAERNYGNLATASDGALYYVQAVQAGASNEPPGENEEAGNELVRFDFEDREAATVLSGVTGFSISANGKQMLISKADGSMAVAEIADELEPEALKLDALRVRVDPREEWAQIFDEAWRMEREFFYDPGMHGLDWQAVRERYRPFLAHVGRREDLNALLVQMIAEMQVGHNRAGGGDVYSEEGAKTGLLGANLVSERGRYRIARVYSGESWNPFIAAPLATPGNEARAGEFILAVNGEPLSADDNIFSRLQGTLGKQVTLRVGPEPGGRDARDIVIEPVESERDLRLWRWVEDNRRLVSERSNGRVGYIYLPNTAGAGYTFFNRMFFAQLDKAALIIDERSNSGGQAANYITEVLSRRHLSGWKDRDGKVFNTPAGAVHGPKVMLIDQDAGSGGDYLPYAFRELGIGKLIGKRTWGGLIGIYANPQLIDGGTLTVPFFRFFDARGHWDIENEGVAPDIEVALDPVETNRGRDTQLARAIDEVLAELEDFDDPIPAEAPPYPTRPGE